MTQKRDIFAELAEGFDALQQQRDGKLTLRTVRMQSRSARTGKPGTRPRQTERSGRPADTYGGEVSGYGAALGDGVGCYIFASCFRPYLLVYGLI